MYIGMAIGKASSPYIRYSSTDKLLEELNFDTSGMSFVEDFSVFNNLKVGGIDGSGTVTLSYLKSHIVKKGSGYITSDDIGRSISVEFLGEEPMVAEIVNIASGIFGAFYNISPSGPPPTGYPAYEYINQGVEQFYVILENKLEEDSFNVSMSFVDTGDVIFNSTATFYMEQSGLGYAYQVNLPAFDITSTLDPSDNETFNFSNITYWNEEATIILGNAGILADLPPNSDTFLVAIGPRGSFPGNAATCYFLSANPPYSENFALPDDAMEYGVTEWLLMISQRSGLEEFDIYTALISDITINEAYVVKSKLDGKYVDITPETSDESPIYANRDGELNLYYGNGLKTIYSGTPSDYEGYNDVKRLEIDYYTASSNLAGAGLATESGKLKVNNASNTTVGGIKIAAQDGVLYISNDGSNPIR